MFIRNNNLITAIILVILLLCVFNLFREKFQIVICPPGQIEGSNGKCKCPLVGQIYDEKKEICKCDIGKKEQIYNDKKICL
jgi:hypothetical protein